MTPYTTRKQPRLFFDCETACNTEALQLMPEPKAPANLKDPEKIKAAIEEKRRELIETAALDPDYGRILSIGYSFGPDMPITVSIVGDTYEFTELNPFTDELGTSVGITTEEMILQDFWHAFSECRGCCVGFNILSFDLPYLMARSMYLGVQVPFIPNLAKFRVEPITDLYAIRYNWGPGKGLKQVCKLLGIPNNCPDVDGSKVKDLDRETLRAYQASDVALVQALFQKMNGVYFNL